MRTPGKAFGWRGGTRLPRDFLSLEGKPTALGELGCQALGRARPGTDAEGMAGGLEGGAGAPRFGCGGRRL